MTKDYTDYLQSLDYPEVNYIDNQESSDEFYGCPEYKQYVDDWC